MTFEGNYMRIQPRIWRFNPRPAGVFGRTRPAGGLWILKRLQILPPPPHLPNSRTGGRSEVGEAEIESSRWVFFKKLLKIFKRSRVRSNSGQRTITSLFALSATESGLITAANPNSAKRHPKGWSRKHISMDLILSKGQGQGQVK